METWMRSRYVTSSFVPGRYQPPLPVYDALTVVEVLILSTFFSLPAQGEDMDAVEAKWRAERGGGNYGAGTQEMQQRNYISKKEAERKRREVFDDGMAKFKGGKIEQVSTGCRIYWHQLMGMGGTSTIKPLHYQPKNGFNLTMRFSCPSSPMKLYFTSHNNEV